MSEQSMMEQWATCKKSAPGAVLLFRLGDFYEAFHEDALVLAKQLELTLTKRQEVPMCGVPFHASETYIDRLVAKGFRVAIAEQLEEAAGAKGLVRREVVRVVTPGTVLSGALLREKANNYIAALAQVGALWGLAALDVTTAEFKVMQFEDPKEILSELALLNPSEMLLSEKCRRNLSLGGLNALLTLREEAHFDHRIACDFLLKHFKVHSLDSFGLGSMPAAINAAGALLRYVSEELNIKLHHVRCVRKESNASYLQIDQTTQNHLELASLLSLLDQTLTPMGGRLLKKWLSHPLLCLEGIRERQEAVTALLAHTRLHAFFEQVRDVERLIMRIETGLAGPRDVVALKCSLEQIPKIKEALQGLAAVRLEKLTDTLPLTTLIHKALVDTPPLRCGEGDTFRAGFSEELDQLRRIKTDSHSWIARYQTELREATQIKTLKVGYTRAFGYYIEVSRGQASKIPPSFQRRQTLVNAERFVTAELKEHEYQVLTAEENLEALETKLFAEVRSQVARHAEAVRAIGAAIAVLDCLFSLAVCAHRRNYVCPVMDEGDTLHIEEGRHPVIEAVCSTFTPNDAHLDAKERLLLITGPNMAGKSTYIRQIALIVILAHMGSFVPAKAARIGLVDKVFSRIGASDDLSRGQSTFMVEMSETANILHNATDRSLVILDEIGRGTSTYDGIAIAWAVATFLLTEKHRRAKTLFATHYWELTELEREVEGAVNVHVAVHEAEGDVVFLHKIAKGAADKSYGIHVARLAGIPTSVIAQAKSKLLKLEKQPSKKPAAQPDLFSLQKEAVLKELARTDPNQITPLEALQKLIGWKARI